MAFSLSDLLNPAPASGNATPDPGVDTAAQPPSADFAPELFEPKEHDLLVQASLPVLAANTTQTLEVAGSDDANGLYPLLKRETSDQQDGMGLPQWLTEGSADRDASMMSQGEDMDDSVPLSQQQGGGKDKNSSSKTPKPRDSQKDKPSKHSSKNEGQHTDRRYLCYLCTKLFTRRRSVRDHIAKIHSVKSWEPLRSLEVIVDPVSGEPIEPIEDIVARGAPAPPAKSPKSAKEKKTQEDEEDSIVEGERAEEAEQGVEPSTKERTPDALRSSPVPAPELGAELEIKHEEYQPVEAKATSPERSAVPAPIIGKKRPAPEVSKPLPAPITKKGIAKPRPIHTPNKKPKLSQSDAISEQGTPIRSPSATPATSSRAPASKLKKQVAIARDSPAPVSSPVASIEPESPSPSAAETPGSSNDDGEIFCICRKGDNHSWMIACDGGCDDWFHGNCVHIRERDGDLIDKYICPNCTRAGLQTTWKRMCRRKDCRKPARVFQDPPSKYCSKECGRMFFVELIRRGGPYIDTIKHDQFVVNGGRPKKMRKKRTRTEKQKVAKAVPIVNDDIGELVNGDSRLATPAPSDDGKSEYETDTSADEDQLPNRGGALRAGEVKAIIDKCTSIEQWRNLGQKPATPPRKPDEKEMKLDFDEFEKKKMQEIMKEKADSQKRNTILDAREKMLELIKTRSAAITEGIKKEGPKDKKRSSKREPCGFDPRVAWTEDSFLEWFDRRDGKGSLDTERIGPPDDVDEDKKMTNGVVEGEDSEDDSEEKEMPKKGGVCVRNRCPRHRNWAKGTLAELRFEQDLVRRALRRCDEAEREIRERAIVKAWERR